MSNRRQFLTGALGGAVAGLTVPSAFAAQAISPLPKKWDMTADVVVAQAPPRPSSPLRTARR